MAALCTDFVLFGYIISYDLHNIYIYIYNIIMYIYICFDGFSHVSPCFPKAAITSAKPGAFREATHGRRKMSELSEETAEELGSKV